MSADRLPHYCGQALIVTDSELLDITLHGRRNVSAKVNGGRTHRHCAGQWNSFRGLREPARFSKRTEKRGVPSRPAGGTNATAVKQLMTALEGRSKGLTPRESGCWEKRRTKQEVGGLGRHGKRVGRCRRGSGPRSARPVQAARGSPVPLWSIAPSSSLGSLLPLALPSSTRRLGWSTLGGTNTNPVGAMFLVLRP